MIAIIVWLVTGVLVGWVASILQGSEGQGALFDLIVGLLGAMIGGFSMSYGATSALTVNEALTPYSFLVSVVGSVVLLSLTALVRRVTR